MRLAPYFGRSAKWHSNARNIFRQSIQNVADVVAGQAGPVVLMVLEASSRKASLFQRPPVRKARFSTKILQAQCKGEPGLQLQKNMLRHLLIFTFIKRATPLITWCTS